MDIIKKINGNFGTFLVNIIENMGRSTTDIVETFLPEQVVEGKITNHSTGSSNRQPISIHEAYYCKYENNSKHPQVFYSSTLYVTNNGDIKNDTNTVGSKEEINKTLRGNHYSLYDQDDIEPKRCTRHAVSRNSNGFSTKSLNMEKYHHRNEGKGTEKHKS